MLWNRAGMTEICQWNHGDEYGESIYTRHCRVVEYLGRLPL